MSREPDQSTINIAIRKRQKPIGVCRHFDNIRMFEFFGSSAHPVNSQKKGIHTLSFLGAIKRRGCRDKLYNSNGSWDSVAEFGFDRPLLDFVAPHLSLIGFITERGYNVTYHKQAGQCSKDTPQSSLPCVSEKSDKSVPCRINFSNHHPDLQKMSGQKLDSVQICNRCYPVSNTSTQPRPIYKTFNPFRSKNKPHKIKTTLSLVFHVMHNNIYYANLEI